MQAGLRLPFGLMLLPSLNMAIMKICLEPVSTFDMRILDAVVALVGGNVRIVEW